MNIESNKEKILELFDDPCYAQIAFDNRHLYQANEPFPHIVLDNFLPQDVAELLAREYPNLNQKNLKHHNHANTSRHFLEDSREFSYGLRLFSEAISSRSFLLFLETITGIRALLPDPYFMGGGAMMTGNGGFLNIHVDFNWHQKMQAWRRCNALFYLTKDWKVDYGGALELWSADGKQKIKQVDPIFNRVVIFSTTATSFHGQPGKVNAPDGMFRNVFSAFYYATQKNELIDSAPHYTKYNTLDDRLGNVADFESSPYSDQITENYLSTVKK